MANIIDYIFWRGDLPFALSPFNDVDNLILAELSYINFEQEVPPDFQTSVTLKEAADAFFARHRGESLSLGLIVPDEILTLCKAAAQSTRFSTVRLQGFVNHLDLEMQEQFSAVTFLLDDDSAYIAFRGTDDSIVGWREDFNMALPGPIPAQIHAAEYLTVAGRAIHTRSSICTGGHSKGGNLAIYASACCEQDVRVRLKTIYCNDGPGFSPAFLQSEGYRAIRSNIRDIVPQNAVIGLLLEHDAPRIVVKSIQNGIYQHDALSWQVLGPAFEDGGTLGAQSLLIDKTLKAWLASMSQKERQDFVDALFGVLAQTEAQTLTELSDNKPALLHAMRSIDRDSRDKLIKTLKLLFGESARTFSALLPQKPK